MLNKCSLQEMAAGVGQINRTVQEVNDLARKNKDSIEGLVEEGEVSGLMRNLGCVMRSFILRHETVF
ncbi:MAG: hypothetical protein ACTTKL_01605 [Treponema sp.]